MMQKSRFWMWGVLGALVIGVIVVTIVLRKNADISTHVPEQVPAEQTMEGPSVIGRSVEGRAIETYTFSHDVEMHEESKRILFVGGIHGGYEWNSVLLAYQFIDYVKENPKVIPEGITVNVIPNLNPDATYKLTGVEGRFTEMNVLASSVDLATTRFNANNVDLNRNFDCKWQRESTWRGNVVSAGTAPFSEPEAQALRDFVLQESPNAVVFWHSQANAVYASECEAGILLETRNLMNVYARAAGYQAIESFDAYPITGDAEGWLASIGIPAITVELSTHEAIEWEKNKAGIEAVLQGYTQIQSE